MSLFNYSATRFKLSNLASPIHGTIRRCTKPIQKFAADRAGAIILIMGLMLPLLIAMVGLSVDVANWYYAERRVQTAADAAATSGAMTLYTSNNSIDAENSAIDSAYRNDFQVGTGRVLQFNSPPTSGSYSGDPTAVEVIATEDQPLYFASVIYQNSVIAQTRSVAAATPVPGDHCILGLDTERDGTVQFTGTADIDMGCGVAVNSISDQALELWGNAEVSAEPMTAVGDIAIGGSATLEPAAQRLRPWSWPVTDPYGPDGRNLQVPNNPSSCTYNNLQLNNDTITLAGGRYCGGLKVSNSDVTFLAGEHIMDGDDFEVSGNSDLSGTGVTFILTGSGSNYATIKWAGGTSADLTAPTSGLLEGVLIFGDPDAQSFQGNTLIDSQYLGGSDMFLTGALYDPAREIVFTGGASLAGNCLQIIARVVTLTGNGAIGNDCPANMDMPPIAAVDIKIVE